MRHQDGWFTGAGGVQLYYQSWHPNGQPVAIVGLIHGLGGHSGLFDRIVQWLVPQGYCVYGLDLRGNGQSPGQRGHINRWTEFREDLGHFLQLLRQQESHLPCFLLGHSLGAVVVLDYVLRSSPDVAGLVLTAPALKPVGVSPLRLLIGQVLSQVYPRFSLNTGIDPDASSRDPAMRAAYAQDPLRHTRGTARLATEFLATTHWIWDHAAELQVPLLILHGDADRVTSADASRHFFEQVTFLDKTYQEYVGGYHEMHDDINYAEVLGDLADWLNQHLLIKAASHG
jgi:alpha-beta hydrolase superfamily lysophospholipase